MKQKPKHPYSTRSYVRFFQVPTRCTIWAGDKLVAYARETRICKKFFDKHGGVYYPKNNNK